jgi:1-acyl-sn-glycerol-3-phosphate acyltransferase
VIRSALWFAFLVVSLIPYATAIVLLSIFTRGTPLYRIAQGWLILVVHAARWIAGVRYRVQGMDNLPRAGSLDPVILCPKHQSTWETFALPSMMSHWHSCSRKSC